MRGLKCVFGRYFIEPTRKARREERVSGHPTPAYLAYFELMRGDGPDVLIVNIRPLDSLETTSYLLWCQAL